MLKAVVKTLALLAILFVIIYVGINNTHAIKFYFPISGMPKQKPVEATAALIFFGMFAVGVLAGTILSVGGGKGAKRGGAKDK